MICNTCNKQIDNDSKFCTLCGHKTVVQVDYTNGDLEPFCEGSRWGYKDKGTRDIILSPRYSQASQYIDKRAIVVLNGKYGVLDQSGKELTQFKYDFISDFENGHAKVKRDGRWTFLDINCNNLTSFIYDSVDSFVLEVAKVKINEKFVLLNKSGKQITENEYDVISDFEDSIAKAKQGDLFGLIDDTGKEILPCKFDEIYEFKDELAQARIVGKYILINKSGEQITKTGYDLISDFENSVTQVKQGNLLGLIDDAGKEIVACKYHHIHKFDNMIAQISYFNKFGFVNLQGKIVIPCKYDEVSIVAQNAIAAREGKVWTCFNNQGEDISESDINFKKFLKSKRRKKRTVKMVWMLLVVMSLTAFIVYDLYMGDAHISRTVQMIFNAEEVYWTDAVTKSSSQNSAPYKAYLDKYPEGKYAETVRSILVSYDDSEAWEISMKSNTIQSFNVYLEKYPKGIHFKDAKRKIAWIDAGNKNTTKALESFITRYPKSQEAKNARQIVSARKKQEAINAGQAWQEVKNVLTEWGIAVSKFDVENILGLTVPGGKFHELATQIQSNDGAYFSFEFDNLTNTNQSQSKISFTGVLTRVDFGTLTKRIFDIKGSSRNVGSEWKLDEIILHEGSQ